MSSKRKNEARKATKGGRRESEQEKSRLLCHFKTQLNLAILLSAHAQTSQANILHLDQKAVFVVSFNSL